MKSFLYVIALLLGLVLDACTPSLQAPEPVEGPNPELCAIDSLMWRQPDSALASILPCFDTCRDAKFCVSTATEYNRHYANLLLAELLYKNDYAQTNRAELLQAVAYFDSLVVDGADTRGVSLQARPRRDAWRASAQNIAFLDARAHYINGVGYYENDSMVEACKEYLKALEVMEDRFGEKELVEKKVQFVALTYTRLSMLFSDVYLHEQAIFFAQVSISYYHKTKVASWFLSRMLSEIGGQYDMMNQLDSAKHYYRNAAIALNDTNSLVYRDIATHQAYLEYEISNQADTAIKALSYYLSISNSLEEYLVRASVIGEIFYHERQYDSARFYLSKVFEESERSDLKKQAAEWLVEINKAQGKESEVVVYAEYLVPFANQEENNSAVKSQLTEMYNSFRQNELERKHIETIHKNTKSTLIIIGGLLVALLAVIFIHLRRKKSLKTQLEAESHAYIMKQKALSGRLKTSNEALRDTLKRLEEKEAELKSIENNSTNYHNTDNYETFKQALVCQEIMKTVHKLHSDKRKTLKTDMNVTEYKAFALSMLQLNQLSKTVDTMFPNLHTSLETIYPNINRNEWLHCCLYLLQVDKKCICVLLQEPYYTCRRCTLKLEEIFNCRHGLTAFLIEQAKAF
jgi:tetratricopeptide (TPR) repeat protein